MMRLKNQLLVATIVSCGGGGRDGGVATGGDNAGCVRALTLVAPPSGDDGGDCRSPWPTGGRRSKMTRASGSRPQMRDDRGGARARARTNEMPPPHGDRPIAGQSGASSEQATGGGDREGDASAYPNCRFQPGQRASSRDERRVDCKSPQRWRRLDRGVATLAARQATANVANALLRARANFASCCKKTFFLLRRAFSIIFGVRFNCHFSIISAKPRFFDAYKFKSSSISYACSCCRPRLCAAVARKLDNGELAPPACRHRDTQMTCFFVLRVHFAWLCDGQRR